MVVRSLSNFVAVRRAGGIAALILVAGGCASMAERTFEELYGKPAIGQPISTRDKVFGPPLSITPTDHGTQIYSYRYPYRNPHKGPTRCRVDYEVRDSTIIAMTHEGKGCKRYDAFF